MAAVPSVRWRRRRSGRWIGGGPRLASFRAATGHRRCRARQGEAGEHAGWRREGLDVRGRCSLSHLLHQDCPGEHRSNVLQQAAKPARGWAEPRHWKVQRSPVSSRCIHGSSRQQLTRRSMLHSEDGPLAAFGRGGCSASLAAASKQRACHQARGKGRTKNAACKPQAASADGGVRAPCSVRVCRSPVRVTERYESIARFKKRRASGRQKKRDSSRDLRYERRCRPYVLPASLAWLGCKACGNYKRR